MILIFLKDIYVDHHICIEKLLVGKENQLHSFTIIRNIMLVVNQAEILHINFMCLLLFFFH